MSLIRTACFGMARKYACSMCIGRWPKTPQMVTQGCHSQEKIRKKEIFFSVSGKSQGIVYQVREILNSTRKSVKSQEILLLGSHLV